MDIAVRIVNALLEGEKTWLDFNQTVGTKPSTGVFRKDVDGVPIFSRECAGCKKYFGNFRTFDEASGIRLCSKCNSDFVDMVQKAHETGNFKPLVKKHHDKGSAK